MLFPCLFPTGSTGNKSMVHSISLSFTFCGMYYDHGYLNIL